jgi:hypothetical protein
MPEHAGRSAWAAGYCGTDRPKRRAQARSPHAGQIATAHPVPRSRSAASCAR